MKKRIEYIDALRGLTMVMVVMFHIVTFSYQTLFVFSWAYNFRIVHNHLFFFIAGFLFYKDTFVWSWNSVKNLLGKKFLTLILPTLIFLSIYGFLYKWSISSIVESKIKAGYWFTYILFIFFLLYSIISLLLSSAKIRGGKMMIIMVSIGLLTTLTESRTMDSIIAKHPFLNVLSLPQWEYFIFFIMGTVAKKYSNKFMQLLDNDYCMSILIILIISSLILFQNSQLGIWGIKVRFVGWGMGCICILFAFFRKYEAQFSNSTLLGKTLQLIGRRTLDIYLLHFFFLSLNMRNVGDFFTKNPNSTLELFVTFLLAMMTIAVSLLASCLLRLNPLLAHWLFGDNLPQKIS